jgi:hypothetical protein
VNSVIGTLLSHSDLPSVLGLPGPCNGPKRRLDVFENSVQEPPEKAGVHLGPGKVSKRSLRRDLIGSFPPGACLFGPACTQLGPTNPCPESISFLPDMPPVDFNDDRQRWLQDHAPCPESAKNKPKLRIVMDPDNETFGQYYE